MTDLTPAAKAMEELDEATSQDGDNLMISDFIEIRGNTIREALALLDRTQRGEAKVLARKATDEMEKVSRMCHPLREGGSITLWAASKWTDMWDAAPAVMEEQK